MGDLSRKIKFSCWVFLLFFLILSSSGCGISKSIKDRPDLSKYNSSIGQRIKVSDTTFTQGSNFLTKNKYGLWELYVEGDPLELGLLEGSLTRELFHYQEDIFMSKVKELVPSKFKQFFLRNFLAWYNRKMYLYIPEQYKAEIYGLSRYASSDYNTIAPPYLRILYLHGAHDIGHALQDLALVACTSFAAWGDKSEDGNLILGRNFDFYAGDEFAKEKIVNFINPSQGYKFMSVSWAGMIGVVSGMNEKGLTVTINAGKSDIPLVAKDPISLVTREILQYAKNIEQAIAIAKKRSVFVSESIMVGSAEDNKAVLIEISPDNFGVYEVVNSNTLVCSNHFQSEAYQSDKKNQKHIQESHSMYRFKRMTELLDVHPKINPKIAVDILRNKEGLAGEKLGLGNEKAINQLLAHHAVVFKPEDRLVWVSTNPYQLGAFVAFDLDSIFNQELPKGDFTLETDGLEIAKDPFVDSKGFKQYIKYRQMKPVLQKAIDQKDSLSPQWIQDFVNSNPYYWEVHYQIGRYYYKKKYYLAALNSFNKAKEFVITTQTDQENLDSYIAKSKRKIN